MIESSSPEIDDENCRPFQPRELMRQRRPHLFSDTVRSEHPEITREVLDYHLETLTKRKQEYQFEHLARALAEKELCPNLRTQTGPTGGGDAKVDSETYAVAPDIAERWFFGETAAKERWAFAFSTKEAWREKVREDVGSIVGTRRDYARIYFITSRYAPDKARAALEDELSTKAEIPVTILDRAWMLDRIYSNRHLELVASTLGLAIAESKRDQVGPNDASRMRQLEALDRQIAEPNRYREARYSLAEDCLTSALLARGLERPRSEVEARFAQARRLSEEFGIVEQIERIIYFEAWTALWWYDDHQRLLDNYQRLETLTASTPFADDLVQLRNLWQLLAGSCIRGILDPDKIDLEGKRSRLVNQLTQFAKDTVRPNNALQAKYALALFDASSAIMARDPAALDLVWDAMIPIIAQGERLLSVPLEGMIHTLEEMDEWVPNSDAYERMLDSFLPLLERRRSEAAAGEALLRRGLQKLEKGQFVDVVRLLGRAELKLAKEESAEPFVQSLLAIASAYRALGLPWAARTKLLMAVDRTFAIMKKDGDIPPSLLRAFYDLTRVEIHLGRLSQALAAWRCFRGFALQLEMETSDRANLADDFHVLARMLGHLMLKATLEQLSALSRLPDVLGSLDLSVAAMLLLWGLGHEDLVRERYLAPQHRSEDLETLLREDLAHPAIKSLPSTVTLGNEPTIELRARLLGSELRLVMANDAAAIHVGEAIASAFEAFLATSLHHKVTPYRDFLRMEIKLGSTDRYSTTWHTKPETWAEVKYPVDVLPNDQPERTGFDIWLRDLIGETIARSFYIADPEQWLTEVAGTEEGFLRAISLGHVPILASSVFADNPVHQLDYWLDAEAADYSVLRTTRWLDEYAPIGANSRTSEDRSSESSPFAVHDHSRVRVTSIIDLPLWDQAGWSGTGMAITADEPPVLALCFRDIEAGAQIFEGWRARFGEVDEDDSLRIAIIQGLSTNDPTGYAVSIGRNVETVQRDNPGQVLTTLSRINRMDRPSPENLTNFLAAYQVHGSYRLVPMRMDREPTLDSFQFNLAIRKKKLEVRRAWEIGPNDPDSLVLMDDDDPIIPAGINDPPVRKALEAVRAMRARQRDGTSASWMDAGAAG